MSLNNLRFLRNLFEFPSALFIPRARDFFFSQKKLLCIFLQVIALFCLSLPLTPKNTIFFFSTKKLTSNSIKISERKKFPVLTGRYPSCRRQQQQQQFSTSSGRLTIRADTLKAYQALPLHFSTLIDLIFLYSARAKAFSANFSPKMKKINLISRASARTKEVEGSEREPKRV